MTICKTYCDHCGKELDDMQDFPDTDIDIYTHRRADLCSKCIHKLDEMIAEFVQKGCEGDGR